MMLKKSVTNTSLLFTIFTLWIVTQWLGGCAKIQYPPGGPVDKTGPIPVAVIPDSFATHVPENIVLKVTFDSRIQAVDPGVVSLSPFPPAGIKVTNDAYSILIEPLEPLQKGRTYRLTVSPNVRDTRGNMMPKPIELTFSTGDSIMTGIIKGKVYDAAKPIGIWIWGWRVDGEFGTRFPIDGPLPWWHAPDAVTITDSAGNFQLAGLENGKYRLLAVDDRDKDRRYDPSADRIGATFDDPFIPRDTSFIFPFQLATLDTVPPALISVRMVAPRIASLRFNRPITTQMGRNPLFRLLSSTDAFGIGYPDPADSTRWFCRFPEITFDDTSAIQVAGIVDRNGLSIPDSTISRRFPSKYPGEDTLRPVLHSLFPSSGPIFANTEWIVTLSQPVEPVTLRKAIRVRNQADSLDLPITISISDALLSRVKLTSDIAPHTRIEFLLTLDSLRTFTGLTGRDSTLSFRFEILPVDTTGGLAGVVIDQWPAKIGKPIVEVLPAFEPGARSGWASTRFRKTLSVTKNQWEGDVMPGVYVVRMFRDANDNGVPDPGRIRPFQFAEPIVVHPDTFRVRSRWTNEGIQVKLR